jgi:hypothetical protein
VVQVAISRTVKFWSIPTIIKLIKLCVKVESGMVGNVLGASEGDKLGMFEGISEGVVEGSLVGGTEIVGAVDGLDDTVGCNEMEGVAEGCGDVVGA